MKRDEQPRTVDHPRRTTGWIVGAALVLSILALSGCQTRINFPAGPKHSETGSANTAGLPTRISNPTPASSGTLALLGDVMLGRGVHPTPETFAYLKPFLISADLALANLESPLTNSPIQTESPYALCAPPQKVEYLVDAGLDLLALSNNHSLDCGKKGLTETQSTLTDAGLGFIGPGAEPVYGSISGIQLAFLELADAGAALIWGHHPHVLQPAEWIRNGRALVLYSLGNALFDQYGLDNTRRSALVLVTFDSYGAEEFKVIPFLIDFQNSRIVGAEQADAQIIMQYFK